MNRKVTVVGGAGNVGATVARVDRAARARRRRDRRHRRHARPPASRSTSISRARSKARRRASIGVGTNDFAESANSDVVVITSGVPRKPGMSRDDLLSVNYKIMQDVTAEIVKHSPNCIIVPVANPLDAMSQAVYRLSKFPRERVIGMAGVLDSARMRTFIAMELKVSVENVSAFVLGGHGDTMVPLPRLSTVAGIPLTELVKMGLLSQAKLDAICTRTANGGAEITKLVGTSAWYAPGASAAADGRGDPEGSEEDHAVLGVPAGRVRHQRPVRRRAGQARAPRGVEQIIEITLDRRRNAPRSRSRPAPSRSWST